MLDTILQSTLSQTSISYIDMLFTMLMSLSMGIVIALVYKKTTEKQYSQMFSLALLFLPNTLSIIILLIGNNIAGAFSLAGILSVIRFRSAPGNSRDITFVMLCMGAGLACGMQAYSYAVIFTILSCLCLMIAYKLDFGKQSKEMMKLTIMIPEDLHFQGVFDETLTRYTQKFDLEQVKTKELGSLFEVAYITTLKRDCDIKKLLDELRCLNGNLNISLTCQATNELF